MACGGMSDRKRTNYLLYSGGALTQIYRLLLTWLTMVLARRLVLVGINSDPPPEVSSFWQGFFLDDLSFEVLIAILTSVVGVGCAFQVFWKYCIHKRAAKLSKHLRFRLQDQYTKPFISDDQSNQDEAVSAIFSDLPKVEEYESNIRFYLFSELFFMILAVIFLFVVSWKLALISIGLVAFVSVGEAFFSRYFLQKMVDDVENLKQEVSSDQINLFYLRELSIISQTQEKEKERLNEKLNTLDGYHSSFLRRNTTFQFFKCYLLQIVGSILVIFTYYNDPDVDSVFAAFVCITILWEIQSSVISVQLMRPVEMEVWGAVIKCEAILEEEERENREGDESGCCCGGSEEGIKDEIMVEMGVEDESIDEEITFEKSFCLRDAELSYTTTGGDVKIVQTNFNLEIQKGEIVGLVGETGCGKSTILRHLMGLMAPAKGNLVVDGKEITQENIGGYLSKIIAVFQFSHLLRRTISENVAYGVDLEKWDGDLVENSLQRAQLLDFAMSFEDGTQHLLEQAENTLSGGQRQRFQLARMFAQGANKEKEIIFADEPTSSLDPKTVQTLLPEFREFLKGRTCVIISHDLSFLDSLCTRIVQIEPLQGDNFPPSDPEMPLPPLSSLYSIVSRVPKRRSRARTRLVPYHQREI